MFSNRLKISRKDANLTLEELANLYNQKFNDAGLNKSTLSKYENNHQKPLGQVISRLAEVLNVSTDYLLGKTDWKNIDEERASIGPDEFAERRAEEKAEEQSRLGPELWDIKYNPPKIMNYYDKLNDVGKKEATKRVEELLFIPQYTNEPKRILNAAHRRTDIEISPEMEKHDDDIMDDDSLWG